MIQGLLVQTKAIFLALTDFRCETDDTILKEHLKSSSLHATCISRTIQNDFIKACGEHQRYDFGRSAGLQIFLNNC